MSPWHENEFLAAIAEAASPFARSICSRGHAVTEGAKELSGACRCDTQTSHELSGACRCDTQTSHELLISDAQGSFHAC